MDALTGWIRSIILLILMATVLEMMLPHSSLQRYVRMVVGLLLLLALLQPVLSVFDMSPDDFFEKLSAPDAISEQEIKNATKNEKSEIQASQHAYIEKQMAVQLKKQVNKEVADRFDFTVDTIQVKLDHHEDPARANIEHVTITMKKGKTSNTHDEVHIQPVDIHVSEPRPEQTAQKKEQTEKYRTFFSKKWGLSKQKITVELEGGDQNNDD